jgi:hypothetical protein
MKKGIDMNKTYAVCITFGVMVCMCACHSLSQAQAQPARLADNNYQQCYQQLEQTLALIVNYPVHLTSSAFSQSSTLSLEKPMPRYANGQHKDGLSLERPQTFKLQLINHQCIVSQLRPQWQATLSACVCLPL